MPTYSLGEIMSSATGAVGRRADVALSDVSRIANDAYFEVWYAIRPEEGEKIAISSTTSGENKIELPSDFWEPISAAIICRPSWSTSSSVQSSYRTLNLVSLAQMDARNPEPGGVPTNAAFYNSWIELDPSPDSGYSFQLRYRSHVTDMLATTMVPSVSTPWRKAIELKTREGVAAFVKDSAAEAKASVDYARYVATLKTSDAIRQSGQFNQGFAFIKSPGGRRRV